MPLKILIACHLILGLAAFVIYNLRPAVVDKKSTAIAIKYLYASAACGICAIAFGIAGIALMLLEIFKS